MQSQQPVQESNQVPFLADHESEKYEQVNEYAQMYQPSIIDQYKQ